MCCRAVLYGMKWVGADPLIWPGALIGFAGAVSTAATGILLAAGLLRVCVLVEAASLVSVVPSLAFAWAGSGLIVYTWALASTQLLLAGIAIGSAARLLQRNWFAVAVVPPVVAAAAGGAAAQGAALLLNHQSALLQLVTTAAAFAVAAVIVLRVCFASLVDSLLGHVPAAAPLRRLLLLDAGRRHLQRRSVPRNNTYEQIVVARRGRRSGDRVRVRRGIRGRLDRRCRRRDLVGRLEVHAGRRRPAGRLRWR